MDSEQQQNKKLSDLDIMFFKTCCPNCSHCDWIEMKNQGLLCSITVVLFSQCQIKSVQPGWREKFKNFQL